MEISAQSHTDWAVKSWRLAFNSMEIKIQS